MSSSKVTLDGDVELSILELGASTLKDDAGRDALIELFERLDLL
jgi:hypothetical protein